MGAIITGFAVFSAPLFAEMEPIASLEDFQWEQRLLIGKVGSAQELRALEAQLDQYAVETLDRKLVALIVYDQHLVARNLQERSIERDSLRGDILKQLGEDNLALIGLDGGVKARFAWDDFALETVFAQIDRMPMRRQELRRRAEDG